MLLVPSARREQQDVILRLEIFDEPSAFCRYQADVFLFRAGHEKPGLFLWDEPTIIKKTSPGRVLKNSFGSPSTVLRTNGGDLKSLMIFRSAEPDEA
jgi:hypothetical protein